MNTAQKRNLFKTCIEWSKSSVKEIFLVNSMLIPIHLLYSFMLPSPQKTICISFLICVLLEISFLWSKSIEISQPNKQSYCLLKLCWQSSIFIKMIFFIEIWNLKISWLMKKDISSSLTLAWVNKTFLLMMRPWQFVEVLNITVLKYFYNKDMADV